MPAHRASTQNSITTEQVQVIEGEHVAKKAVLIGINRYRVPGADLRGCVPDVKNMSKLLQQQYGFDASDIHMLTDLDATKKAIEDAITTLVAGGRRGDVLLLHYSGHGSNVPDDNGDEEDDNRDEILCPTDLDWQDTLRDDWLRGVFDGLKDGVNLTVISDSCHSGTITRAIEPPDAPILERYLPSPWDLVTVESGRTLGASRGGLHRAAVAERSASDVVDVPDMAEVLISGCRADQTSADAAIAGGYAGALTYHLVEALTEASGPLTYRELHQETLAKLRRGRYEQIPQLEGNTARLDQPFLSPIE